MHYTYNLKTGVQKVKSKASRVVASAILGVGGLSLGLIAPLGAHAATTVTVTPSDTMGWAQKDSTAGGSTAYVADSTTPFGDSALQLKTDDTNAAKADYFKSADDMPLKDVTEFAYSTKQIAASSPAGDASFQLAIDTNGAAPDVPGVSGFTTLVYEPYWQNDQSPDAAPVVANTWQTWDVDQGVFWSSNSVGGMTAGSGGSPFYTLAQVEQMNPDATLQSYGVNVGSYNPSYTINVDGVVFNGTTYDFELVAPDTQAPDVAITNPTNGSTVQGTVDIKGTVTDANPDHYYLVVKNADGQKVAGPGTVNDTQSFTDQSLYNWDTTQVPDGAYTIDLEARDQAGNKDAGSVATVTVTVNNTVDNKDQCKDGGWATFTSPSFKNQGQCVSYANHHDGNGADDTHAVRP
jgi:hypothetical protein